MDVRDGTGPSGMTGVTEATTSTARGAPVPLPLGGVGRAPRAQRPRPAPPRGVWGGIATFFSGLGFVVTRPRVWPWALVPVLVALVLTVLFTVLGISFGVDAFEAWGTAPADGGTLWPVLHGAAVIAIYLGAIAISLVLGLVLAQPLSGPALDRIVHLQERELGGVTYPDTPFWSAVGRSIAVTAATLVVGAPLLLAITVVDALVPPAVVITWPLKLCISALLATWNFVDYPFALRGAGIDQRFAWCKRHAGACLGFGLVAALLALVPLIGLLVLPVGVAGAARLVNLTEGDAASRG